MAIQDEKLKSARHVLERFFCFWFWFWFWVWLPLGLPLGVPLGLPLGLPLGTLFFPRAKPM